MAAIDYTNECDNDEHNPGCICGVPFFNPKARVSTTTKTDPYCLTEPNKLYFRKYDPTFSGDEQVHYWLLTNSTGRVFASSREIFMSKLEAIQNAIAVFGRELRAGDHRIVDDKDNTLVLEELHRIEAEINPIEKKAG